MNKQDLTPEAFEHLLDINKRLQGIEEVTKALTEGKLEKYIDTIASIAAAGFLMAFIAFAVQVPEQARKLKDDLSSALKKAGFSQKQLDLVMEVLLPICDICDQWSKPK